MRRKLLLISCLFAVASWAGQALYFTHVLPILPRVHRVPDELWWMVFAPVLCACVIAGVWLKDVEELALAVLAVAGALVVYALVASQLLWPGRLRNPVVPPGESWAGGVMGGTVLYMLLVAAVHAVRRGIQGIMRPLSRRHEP